MEAAIDIAELRRDVIDLRKRIKLFSKRRKTVGAAASKNAEFQRESADLRRRAKFLIQRSCEIDAKLGAIPAATEHPLKFESSPPVECSWKDDFTMEDSDCDGGPPGDSLDATSDIYSLFTYDPTAYIPPSSGNPIYDDYADDEFELTPRLGDLIYDDYGDDEVQVQVELAPSLGEPIYDDYVDVEEETEDCLTEDISPIFLSQEISFVPLPHAPEVEELYIGLQFPVEPYLDPFDVTYLDKGIGVLLSGRALLDFSIGVVSGNDTSFDVVIQTDGDMGKYVLFDSDIIIFSLMLRRYVLFIWKPGWSFRRRSSAHSASDSRTNLFCPGENDAGRSLLGF